MPRPPCRRTFLALALAEAGLACFAPAPTWATGALLVGNVTGLYPVSVARIAEPQSAKEVAALVRAWPGKVAVGGGRYSMGGQVAVKDGLHVDMRQMNRLVWLRATDAVVRVEAGMRWRDLQDHLDPVGLAVKTMQSYSNFTVGGSVSVNAHGRYVGHGPVGHSVRSLQLVLAEGTIVEASRTLNPDLFRAALGGYGAVGIITEVELDLARNVRIERVVEAVSLANYVSHFKSKVLANPRAILHNADLLPPAFDAPVSVSWLRANPDAPLTEPEPLVPRGRAYALEQNVIWALTELPGGNTLRESVVHPLLTSKPATQWLNHEASLDVAELEPRTRAISTYVLQEYFVPERHFLAFAQEMAKVLRARDVEALNVSIRHSPADRDALMPWARQDVFSFVLYYKQRTWQSAQDEVGRWTRELIDAVLRHEGRYYLPYQLHASASQFEAAYPEAAELRRVKRQHDPSGKFSNELWRRYL
jgi:FAD/FMN-containing dehydrogenase